MSESVENVASGIGTEPAATYQAQVDCTTFPNRYPTIFEFTSKLRQRLLPENQKVLSFGCSRGEETVTLAQTYFPDDEVFGVDINLSALDFAASQNSLNGRIKYALSTPEVLKRNGPFDAVFALSVLCAWPTSRNLRDISEIFPFSRFYALMSELHQNLRVGGILVLYNCSFSFLDTRMSSAYEVIFNPKIASNGFVKKFSTGNIEDPGFKGTDFVYRKLEDEIAAEGDPRNIRIANEFGHRIGVLSAGSWPVLGLSESR